MLKSLGKNGKDRQQDVDDSIRPTVGVVRKFASKVIRYPGWMGLDIPLAQIDTVNNLRDPYVSLQRNARPRKPLRKSMVLNETQLGPLLPNVSLELANNLRLLLKAHFAPSGTTRRAVPESQRLTQAHIDKCTAANPSGVCISSKDPA
ncbi:MAG: hypothetical protein Q9192_006049 [Flavoplaca navasiana]